MRKETGNTYKKQWEKSLKRKRKQYINVKTAEKRDRKKRKGNGKTIDSCGEYIVIQHARWGEAGENWRQNAGMDNKSFNIKERGG